MTEDRQKGEPGPIHNHVITILMLIGGAVGAYFGGKVKAEKECSLALQEDCSLVAY